jgi:exonuclease SbcC
MVPLSLRLRNFLSYGLEGGELDLRPLHLACLSGANGNGKSALVDAITWALWGRSRAGREDELLRHGTDEMEVEFEFSCHHDVYRVIRKRTLRKSGGVATLELAIRDGEVYRAITGNTIGDTERAISRILRLSYETFINSSLLLQGRADLFTVKRPAERKEILGEILGLGEYEALAERAREREREFRALAEQRRARVEEIDRFLAGVPDLELALRAAEAGECEVRREREAAEGTVADCDRRVQALVGVQETLSRLGQRLKAIGIEEAEARARLDAARASSAKASVLLAGEQSLREQVSRLQADRLVNDRLVALRVLVSALDTRVAETGATIAAEEARLKAEIHAAQKALKGTAEAQKSLAALEGELVFVRERLAGLPKALAERAQAVAAVSGLTEEVGKTRGTITALESRMNELRDKIRRLKSAGATCPTCGTALDEAHRAEVLQAATQDGIACKAEVARTAEREAALVKDQLAAKASLIDLDTRITAGHAASLREAELAEKGRALRALCDTAGALNDEITRKSDRVLRGEFAAEARAAVALLQQQKEGLGYDQQAHDAVTASIRALLPAESMLATLDQAHADLQASAVEQSVAATRLEALAEERERLAREQEPLRATVVELPALRQALEEAQGRLRERRAAESAIQQRLGGLRAQLQDAERRQTERTEVARELADAERQGWAHKELAVIFGKRGIQAMLIENALPELEQDANDLLARMTDNSTQVKFATQRIGTGGKAIETLEIKIADTMGTRTYEMFSGGEAFRINFAIRIALSKLLARGAGADLSFLLIDEGFGTQDAQGRDRLVEAISAIADDFEKILVVTHIDELKDQFDVHVEVSKGPGGSHINVSAA